MTTDNADRIVRFEEVLSRTGLTRSTLYRKIAARTFPKQIAISARCRGWRESELNDWLHNPMSYEQEESPLASRTGGADARRTEYNEFDFDD